MKASSERFNDGLERAALHLQRKADKMREANGVTSRAMAQIFETEAAEILEQRLKD